MGNYEIIDRFCEATTHLLDIIKMQEKIIAQCEISEEVQKELSELKQNSDYEMDCIEYRLRRYK